MTWTWRSPEATRAGLSARIRDRYPVEERGARVREIAYRRLLHRLSVVAPGEWVLKGGVGLLLRLDPNRTSNDIDLTYLVEAGEHGLALAALREAASHDAGDFFSFELGGGEPEDPEHPLERTLNVPVVARVGETEFARFHIDLGLPRNDLETEWIESETELTGDPEVDHLQPILALTFEAQLADKTCAIFEMHGRESDKHSSRPRDLADIAMIARQREIDGSRLTERLRLEEDRRRAAGSLTAPIPTHLNFAAAQEQDWRDRWTRATRSAPIDFDDALRVARKLLNPVLADEARGKRWRPDGHAWRSA